MNYAVIMAGGRGTRFWPLSREKKPKQFLAFTSSETMMEETLHRIAPLVPKNNTLIITNKIQMPEARKAAKTIPARNILAEPVGRNTAPCLGLAAHWISKIAGKADAVLVALPADHFVSDTVKFQKLMRLAIAEAKKTEAILVFGIPPRYPETGFGYIEAKPKTHSRSKVIGVKRFVEKPDHKTALRYLRRGNFYWNSGIFVARASVIQTAFARFLPKMNQDLARIAETAGTREFDHFLNQIYPRLENISVDYGIMEKYEDIRMIPAEVGWEDLGSWASLAEHFPRDAKGNTLSPKTIFMESENSFVESKKPCVILLGVKDLIVVETPDALLVTTKDKSQDIRKVTEILGKSARLRHLL